MPCKNMPNVLTAILLKSRYEYYMVLHHSSPISHFSSFKIEGMLFPPQNFIFNEVSDENSSSDSLLKESLVQQPHSFTFGVGKGFQN